MKRVSNGLQKIGLRRAGLPLQLTVVQGIKTPALLRDNTLTSNLTRGTSTGPPAVLLRREGNMLREGSLRKQHGQIGCRKRHGAAAAIIVNLHFKGLTVATQ